MNAPFYVGQKVVCVDDKRRDEYPSPVKKHEQYTVAGIQRCICGLWMVDVGCNSDTGTSCFCGVEYDGEIWWQFAKRFAPIEEKTYEDVRKELAVLPTDETPDVKKIKDLVN